MLKLTQLAGFGGARLWDGAAGVDFDGTNDWLGLDVDLSGIADGPQGIVSFWFRLDGGNGVSQKFCQSSGNTYVQRTSGNTIEVNFRGTGELTMATVGTHTASATWKHFLASWDTNVVGARHIYVADTADTSVSTFNPGNIDYTRGEFYVGARKAGGSAAELVNGCMAEFFFHTSWLDISIEANRRKFIDATGRPEFLGESGQLPLGVTPLVYCSRRAGEAVSTFVTNRGSGGGFTLTGSLDASSSNP